MASKPTGLGRGLGALIQDVPTATPEPQPTAPAKGGVTRITVGQIRRSPWQPRHIFEQEALSELVASVRERGVLQPLLVRHSGDQFELIAGERRLRAAMEVGLIDVPAIVMEVTDREALEIALVENLQRSDLNLIEEAEGYRALADKFQMTQEQIATRVGKARPTIANAMRLLELPDTVKQLVAEKRLSPGHAKALLGLENRKEIELLAHRAVSEELSVRTLENIVARTKREPRKPRAEKQDIPEQHVRYLVERLHQHFGTPVRIASCRTLANGKKVKGMIELDFHSSDELDRLLVILGITESF
jgi:ParB family chromosome partitioning protein